MHRQVAIDREAQETMKTRVREVIAAGPAYDDIRAALEDLGFQAKEDNPALALWENGENELFVMVHMDPDTGRLRDYEVKTFEDMEGFE